MIINEKVTVGIVDSTPKYVVWRRRNYIILKIGLHHLYHEGKTLYHVFSVVAGTIFMRLKFNTDTLGWRLEEMSDSLVD